MGKVAELRIAVDESILFSLKEGKRKFTEDMLFNHALTLYRKGKLSIGKAAELAGLERIDFIVKMNYEGEYIFDYNSDMIDELIKKSEKASKPHPSKKK